LSAFGLSESYTSLTSKRLRRIWQTKKNISGVPDERSIAEKQAGTINQLQMSVREEARQLAATGLFGEVLDNLNFRFDVAEQTLGSHGTSPYFDVMPHIFMVLQTHRKTGRAQQSGSSTTQASKILMATDSWRRF
jgi:hypothetical protein